MKQIIFTLFFTILTITLVPNYCFAGDNGTEPIDQEYIVFPNEGYTLHVASTYILIYGDDLPAGALIAGLCRNSMEMTSRNAWIAILLNAVATGKKVDVIYAGNDTTAKQYGIGTALREGTIIAVQTKY